jgi:hypothetical protein
MSIDPGAVPQAAIAAVELAMHERAARAGFATPQLRRANVRALARSTPHRVAYLTANRIKDPGSLRELVEPAGWRFLIHEHDKVIAAARAVIQEGQGYRLAELSEGEFAAGTEGAIRFAETLPQVQAGRFEAVLVMVPELHVIALWLQNLEGDSDLVLPIPSTAASNPGWNPNRVMESAAFVENLRRIAERSRNP